MKFLARCVLPDKKLYSNCLYSCKYVRDFDESFQLISEQIQIIRMGPKTSAKYLLLFPCLLVWTKLIAFKTTFQVLYTNIVICTTCPYYANRHQGRSKNLNFPTSARQLKLDVKINAATYTWRVLKKHEKTGIKTPVNQKIYHLNTLHLYPYPKPENKTSYRTLISSCWPTDIRLFEFYRKLRLGLDQSRI